MKFAKTAKTNTQYHIFLEELRRVRTLLRQHDTIKVIHFINSVATESIYHHSYELVKSFSMIGKKTVFVNLNLKSIGLYNADVKNDVVSGIEEYLVNKADINHLPIQVKEGFDLISNREVIENSTDILDEEKLQKLFNDLRSKYDYVFVSTPSLVQSYDALIVGKFCDGMVYLKEDRLPKKSLILKHAQLINQLNKPMLGLMITHIEK